jgi:hypothetical protein
VPRSHQSGRVFVRSGDVIFFLDNHHIFLDGRWHSDDKMAIEILDDKSEHCIPFILDKIKAHCEYYKKEGKDAPPFFLGLNGIQGAGKTTLVSD